MSSPRRLLVGRPTGTRRQPLAASPTSDPAASSSVPAGAGARPTSTPGKPTAAAGRRPSALEARAEQLAAARGYADGLARGQAEVAAAVGAAGSLAAELERLAPRDVGRAAAAISRLALLVAERILGRAVAVDPALLVEVVARAAETINGSPTARVILHPTARPIVEAAWVARYGTAYLGKRWLFEADPSLPPTGCRLVYEHGFVDASLEAQVEELGRAMEHALPALVRDVGRLAVAPALGDPTGNER